MESISRNLLILVFAAGLLLLMSYNMKTPIQGESPHDMKLLPLHVSGNEIKNSKDETVHLRGVSMASFEWHKPGMHTEQWFKTLEEWGGNFVRLPFNPNWVMGSASDEGEAYLQNIDRVVNWCEEHGMYVMLDCHQAPASCETWWIMWELIAARYDDREYVLFDIYNEPHNETWCPDSEWPAAAQECVNRIRKLSNNVIAVGGTAFSRNIDPVRRITGENIVWKLHLYTHYTEFGYTKESINNYLGSKGWKDINKPVIVAETGAKMGNKTQADWLRTFLQYSVDRGWSFAVWNTNPSTGWSVFETDYKTATFAGEVLQEFLRQPD